MPLPIRSLPLAVVAAAALVSTAAVGQTPPPVAAPAHVVNLSSSASVDVPKDSMTVVFSTTKDGADAAAVQSLLKQALDAALAEARKAARPGQLDVQTGNFALYPRYGSKGLPNGWQGTAELLVEGRDLAAIGQLAGRISTLTIARVGYGLSREQRDKAEADVAAAAIARYRAKAADYARQFGYAGYQLMEVAVSASEPPPMPVAPMRMKALTAAGAEESLPVEAGKATVTVNVSGTVQLTR